MNFLQKSWICHCRSVKSKNHIKSIIDFLILRSRLYPFTFSMARALISCNSYMRLIT